MSFARYFSPEWKDRFTAYKASKAIWQTAKCRLDRMPLASGHPITQQQEPKQMPIATHKLMCKASFDIALVSFFVVSAQKFLVNDWQKIGDVYIVSLHSKGQWLEKE